MKIETYPGNLKFKKEPQLSRCTKSDVENNGWGWEGGGGKRKGLVLITSTGEEEGSGCRWAGCKMRTPVPVHVAPGGIAWDILCINAWYMVGVHSSQFRPFSPVDSR